MVEWFHSLSFEVRIAVFVLFSGSRAPWRTLSIVRRPPTFQKTLIYAAEGNVERIKECIAEGYDINYRFDEFQKSTVTYFHSFSQKQIHKVVFPSLRYLI